MSPAQDFLESGQEFIEDFLALPSTGECEQITFELVDDSEFSCPAVPGTLDEALNLIPGGYEKNVRFILRVRRSHFLTVDSTEITVDSMTLTADNMTPLPRPTKIVQFRGRTLRIDSAGEDGARSYVRLVLVDKNAR